MMRLVPEQQETLRGHVEGPFAPLAILGEQARGMLASETDEAYGEALSCHIEGQAHSAEIDRYLIRHDMAIVDRTTALLARHISIDVVTVLAIALTLDINVEIEDEATNTLAFLVNAWHRTDEPGCLTSCWLSDDVLWTAGGVVLDLPDTLAAGAIGRPLRTVVSHPVLDRLDLTVTGIGDSYGRKLRLDTDANLTPITTKELIAMRTREG